MLSLLPALKMRDPQAGPSGLHGPTHTGPLVAVVDVEDLAVEGDIDTHVEVLPVPVVPHVILRQSLSLDQFACRTTQPVVTPQFR